MIIEHSESRQYIDQTYKNRGSVSVFHIEIDIEGLRSAWTPVKDEAVAFQVYDEEGKELFLYTDEMDNYARMFVVPSDRVVSRKHQKDIVNPENLPGVGHFYREERERKELQDKLQAENEIKLNKLVNSFVTYHGHVWEQMNSVNRRYGNIYDTGEGKESYIASKAKPTLYSIPPPAEGYVLPVIALLDRFERKTGVPFTPSLDDDAESKDRLKDLTEQLTKAVFIAEQGYFPEVKQDYEGVDENEVVMNYFLRDKYDNPLATVKVHYQESEDFTGCVEEPIVVAVDFHGAQEPYDIDTSESTNDFVNAFNSFLKKAHGDEQWVVDPDNVGPRKILNSMDQDELLEVTRFMDIEEGMKFSWNRRCLEEIHEIGDLLKESVKNKEYEADTSPSP